MDNEEPSQELRIPTIIKILAIGSELGFTMYVMLSSINKIISLQFYPAQNFEHLYSPENAIIRFRQNLGIRKNIPGLWLMLTNC